jgi:hypothetical protein
MKIDNNKSSIEFKQELIEKYDVKSVNASGHLAIALTTFQYISLFIPDGLSWDQEENIIYSYLNGESNQQKVKENLNLIQEEFVMNCQIAIINNSPNLFKESSISTKVGINISILALGTLGSSMGEHKINDNYTANHLHEDLFFLYFKMYFDYLKLDRLKIMLNPNNKYKVEDTNQQVSSSPKGGCLGVIIFLIISIASAVTFLEHNYYI